MRGLLSSLTVRPSLSMCECGAAGSVSGWTACPPRLSHTPPVSGSHCSKASPLRPGCPSLPVLPVWMNVYFLSLWLSDFLAVRFSVSSGCAKRHSVSTYTSILVLGANFLKSISSTSSLSTHTHTHPHTHYGSVSLKNFEQFLSVFKTFNA